MLILTGLPAFYMQVIKNQHMLLVTLLLCNALATEVGCGVGGSSGCAHTGKAPKSSK